MGTEGRPTVLEHVTRFLGIEAPYWDMLFLRWTVCTAISASRLSTLPGIPLYREFLISSIIELICWPHLVLHHESGSAAAGCFVGFGLGEVAAVHALGAN